LTSFSAFAEFGADKDDVQFPSEAAKLQIVSADPHLNKLLSKYCDEVLAARKVPSWPLRVNVENLIAPFDADALRSLTHDIMDVSWAS
jgi:hypothetical protein